MQAIQFHVYEVCAQHMLYSGRKLKAVRLVYPAKARWIIFQWCLQLQILWCTCVYIPYSCMLTSYAVIVRVCWELLTDSGMSACVHVRGGGGREWLGGVGSSVPCITHSSTPQTYMRDDICILDLFHVNYNQYILLHSTTVQLSNYHPSPPTHMYIFTPPPPLHPTHT